MRALLLALAFFATTALPAAAQQVFDDPKALIAYAYEPYESGEFPEDMTELFSPTLVELWNAMAARSEEAEMPIIDFDPFINAQDYELTDLVIADPVVEGDTASVAVSFSNFGGPTELRFDLIDTADGWKIDDIEAPTGEYPWRLSELLAADPMLN
jgi:hypothetical protein